MVNTVVEICNLALIRLGDARIISLTEGSKAAILCSHLYEQTRDEVLEDHDWQCATKRATLAQLDETPTFGYDYVYALPTNPYCLRVLDANDEDYDYRIEENKLYTDEDDISIRYVAKITSPPEFSSLLAEAIVLKLASKLAIPLTKSQQLYTIMAGEYMAMLNKAKGKDKEEMTQDTDDDETDYWEDSR